MTRGLITSQKLNCVFHIATIKHCRKIISTTDLLILPTRLLHNFLNAHKAIPTYIYLS